MQELIKFLDKHNVIYCIWGCFIILPRTVSLFILKKLRKIYLVEENKYSYLIYICDKKNKTSAKIIKIGIKIVCFFISCYVKLFNKKT